MTILALPAAPVKSARTLRPAALDWPTSPEFDGFNWELGPDPADARHWAEQNIDAHTSDTTPIEILGDGPEPDWDGMADESLALDCYTRGFVPL